MSQNESKNKKEKEFYSSKLFLNAVLPLLKYISADVSKLKEKWKGVNAICQVSCRTEDAVDGIHFIIEDGEWTVKRGCHEEKPDVELQFKSREHLNNFFKGKALPLPKMKGVVSHFGVFAKFFSTLMSMASLLGKTEPPDDEEQQVLLTKCMFYLLSTGISTLNKLGHPAIR